MSDDVTNWLEELGLGEYASVFEKNNVDIEVLPELTDADLKELGVTLGHRKRVLKAIRALTEVELDPPVSPATPLAGVTTAVTTDSDASLAAWERMPGERKPVTMLFADITGSTALTEKLDAEETHDLLYGATQRMCAAVENNQGTVCRFMGDGVMSMFGAPVASEHHAIDACEAALEMQHAIRDYASDIEGLQIRVGLHSGEVVVLTVGEGDKVEYDASGPTVPIAARMEQVAEPGAVYITTATHQLAGARIEAEALDPVLLKGISDPVPVFALHRVRSIEERPVDAARTPIVGRRAELRQFQGMLDACIEDGHGQTVIVRGEPGIGKTRLVEEFARIAANKGVVCHRGLVLDFGVGKGQDAIRALVRSFLEIPFGSAEAARERAADRAIDGGLLDRDQRVYLNDLLDLPQPIELRALYDAMDNATRNAGKRSVVSRLVTRVSGNQPILATMEDVHWADTITLAHLAILAKAVAECSALLVLTSRIEGDPLDQTWRSRTEGCPIITIDLGPLRRDESRALIREFMDSTAPLAKDCLERAAGNPLFLEQLLRNAGEGSAESLPDSIQSLVLARTDRLSPIDKRAMQAASVIGQRFEVESLRYVLATPSYDCSALVEHNLVRPEGAAAYLFAHALLREGVYGSLLKRQRRALHRRAAEWFSDSDAVLYAEHLDLCDDERAPGAYLIAAREQTEQYRVERALALVNRGIEIAPEPESLALRCLEGELLRSLGSVPESINAYRRASEVATEDVDHCHALIGVAEGLRITEQYDELVGTLDHAEVIAKDNEISSDLARIYQLRGGIHFIRGEIEACLQSSTTALKHARDATSPELEAQTLSSLGDAEYARGRMISANDYFHRCIELSREHGFGRAVAANLSMRAITHYYRTDLEAAEDDFRSARELAATIRQPRAEMLALGGGIYIAEMGKLAEGEDWIRARLDIARRLGSRIFEGNSLAVLGSIIAQTGRRVEAQVLVQAAIAILRESESAMRFAGPHALGTLALVTDAPDERHLALKEGQALLLGDSVSHNYLRFYRDAMETCLQMAEWDELERYAAALENYTYDEPLPWSDFYIARGRALAAFGRGSGDEATMQELQRLRDEAERVGLKGAIPALEEALLSI